MGQAKQRGSQAERIRQAQERIEAQKPDFIVCNNCQTHILDFRAMNTRGMEGIDAAFGGVCPSCKQTTYAIKGKPDAVADFSLAMDEVMGADAKVGAQLIHHSNRD